MDQDQRLNKNYTFEHDGKHRSRTNTEEYRNERENLEILINESSVIVRNLGSKDTNSGRSSERFSLDGGPYGVHEVSGNSVWRYSGKIRYMRAGPFDVDLICKNGVLLFEGAAVFSIVAPDIGVTGDFRCGSPPLVVSEQNLPYEPWFKKILDRTFELIQTSKRFVEVDKKRIYLPTFKLIY